MQQTSFEFDEAADRFDVAAANPRFQRKGSNRECTQADCHRSIHLRSGNIDDGLLSGIEGVLSVRGSGMTSVPTDHHTRQNCPGRPGHSSGAARPVYLSRRCPGSSSEMHLAAARRLSKEIRRTHYHSPEATRTGRLVCRHLVAMLQSNGSRQNQAAAKQDA